MYAELKDLQPNQALEIVKALVNSQYFRQYVTRECELFCPPTKLEVGGWDKTNHDWVKVKDVAPYIDLLVEKSLRNKQDADFKGRLSFYVPYKTKRKRFGLKSWDAENIMMGLYATIEKDKNSKTYTFEGYADELKEGSKTLIKNYDKWHKEMDRELKKILQRIPKSHA